MILPLDDVPVLIVATLLWVTLIALGAGWSVRPVGGRHTGEPPSTYEVFCARIRGNRLQAPVVEAEAEAEPDAHGPFLTRFARTIATHPSAPPTDPDGIALGDTQALAPQELEALVAGRAGAGALPYRGPVPVQRAYACSYCRDGQIRLSRDGTCAWACGIAAVDRPGASS